MKRLILSAAFTAISATALFADDARVYVVNLENGATVSSPVTVVFGLSGKGVAPASVEKDGTGHHHVLLNRAPFGEGPEDDWMLEVGIPSDDNHLHFGGGQTQVTLELPAGEHTLQLLLGDHNHVPHDPVVVSEQISITVSE